MGTGNDRALAEGLLADHGQHQGLAPVVLVDLVAGLERHAGHIGHKALGLRQSNGVADRLPLGAGPVQEGHIGPAVVLQGEALLGVDPVIAVLLLVKQLFSQFSSMDFLLYQSVEIAFLSRTPASSPLFSRTQSQFSIKYSSGLWASIRASAVVPADAVPRHDALYARLLLRQHGDGDIAARGEPAGEQFNGVHRREASARHGPVPQALFHFRTHIAVGDGVEVLQRLRIRKDDAPSALRSSTPSVTVPGKALPAPRAAPVLSSSS